jgi:hypothetical protein
MIIKFLILHLVIVVAIVAGSSSSNCSQEWESCWPINMSPTADDKAFKTLIVKLRNKVQSKHITGTLRQSFKDLDQVSKVIIFKSILTTSEASSIF